MKPISEIKQKIENLLEHHSEIFIELRGREALLAEGYCRIEEYSETRVTLISANNSVLVKGEKLTLRHLSNERIAIDGRIDSVEFL